MHATMKATEHHQSQAGKQVGSTVAVCHNSALLACWQCKADLIILVIIFFVLIVIFVFITVLHLSFPGEPLDGMWDDVIPQALPEDPEHPLLISKTHSFPDSNTQQHKVHMSPTLQLGHRQVLHIICA